MKTRRSSWIVSFGYAARGILITIRQERHMQFHLFAALAVTAAGIALDVGRTDWLWLGAASAMVLSFELMNTAVERAVDLAQAAPHPLAKAAKDAAAGAVLIVAAFAAAAGLVILGPPLWRAVFG